MLENKVSDPYEGLELQDGIEQSVLISIKAVNEGEPTYEASEVAEKLGLNWYCNSQ